MIKRPLYWKAIITIYPPNIILPSDFEWQHMTCIKTNGADSFVPIDGIYFRLTLTKRVWQGLDPKRTLSSIHRIPDVFEKTIHKNMSFWIKLFVILRYDVAVLHHHVKVALDLSLITRRRKIVMKMLKDSSPGQLCKTFDNCVSCFLSAVLCASLLTFQSHLRRKLGQFKAYEE